MIVENLHLTAAVCRVAQLVVGSYVRSVDQTALQDHLKMVPLVSNDRGVRHENSFSRTSTRDKPVEVFQVTGVTSWCIVPWHILPATGRILCWCLRVANRDRSGHVCMKPTDIFKLSGAAEEHGARQSPREHGASIKVIAAVAHGFCRMDAGVQISPDDKGAWCDGDGREL